LTSGTTTATVLTRAILSEGTKSVAAGMNPMDLRRGINVAVQAVVADLKLRATNISTTEEISQVRSPGREVDGGAVRLWDLVLWEDPELGWAESHATGGDLGGGEVLLLL